MWKSIFILAFVLNCIFRWSLHLCNSGLCVHLVWALADVLSFVFFAVLKRSLNNGHHDPFSYKTWLLVSHMYLDLSDTNTSVFIAQLRVTFGLFVFCTWVLGE